jgi:LysM repeat protein
MEFKKIQSADCDNSKKPAAQNKSYYLYGTQFVIKLFITTSFVLPLYTNAGVINKIAQFLGINAEAQSIQSEHNSQNLPLLEANINTANSQKALKTNEALHMNDEVLETELGIMGTSLDIIEYPEEDTINVYTTKQGDTLSQIAKMYNVSINTIIWANPNIDNKTKLKEGTSLLIMPVDGVKHTVKKGDTLAKIANSYKADKDEIAKFNGISDESLAIGDIIIVPDGEITVKKPVAKTTVKKNKNGTSKIIAGYGGASGGSYFRKPVRCVITQGLHGKNGIDLGCPVGTRIAAAASGRVIAARMGWNGGYGNMIIISHANGTQTLYGHLSSINVSEGSTVDDGEIIGATGNSGRSTGPHLHFETRGARNCYADNSCR